MGYRLKDLGYKWKTITQGRHNVGRVWQHDETKVWHGMIGKHEATGATATEAFYEVAAQAMGYADHSTLQAHNRKVRASNKMRREVVRRDMAGLLGGDDELAKLFGKIMGLR